MLDLYLRQQSSAAQNQQSNIIRNKLQQHIRNLLSSVHRRINAGLTNDERQQLIGELKGYIAIRKHLAPVVAQDRFDQSIYAAIASLESKAESLSA